jgi:hypothetical protein
LFATSSPLLPRKRLVWGGGPGFGSVLFHLVSCMFWSRRRQSVSKQIKPCGCTVSTMDLSEARGLVLFRVIRGGIGITQRLMPEAPSTGVSHTHPRTRASQEPTDHHQKKSPEMEGVFTRDAQAACDFSFSASKLSPFFHRVSVMAAILRASVRRAMVGLMPLASAAW